MMYSHKLFARDPFDLYSFSKVDPDFHQNLQIMDMESSG